MQTARVSVRQGRRHSGGGFFLGWLADRKSARTSQHRPGICWHGFPIVVVSNTGHVCSTRVARGVSCEIRCPGFALERGCAPGDHVANALVIFRTRSSRALATSHCHDEGSMRSRRTRETSENAYSGLPAARFRYSSAAGQLGELTAAEIRPGEGVATWILPVTVARWID